MIKDPVTYNKIIKKIDSLLKEIICEKSFLKLAKDYEIFINKKLNQIIAEANMGSKTPVNIKKFSQDYLSTESMAVNMISNLQSIHEAFSTKGDITEHYQNHRDLSAAFPDIYFYAKLKYVDD